MQQEHRYRRPEQAQDQDHNTGMSLINYVKISVNFSFTMDAHVTTTAQVTSFYAYLQEAARELDNVLFDEYKFSIDGGSQAVLCELTTEYVLLQWLKVSKLVTIASKWTPDLIQRANVWRSLRRP